MRACFYLAGASFRTRRKLRIGDLRPYPGQETPPYALRMDERKVREKQLQDARFSSNGGSRGGVDRAYWITGESHSQFRRRIVADAAGKRVLEIGCGAGANVMALCKEGARVTGIDLSEVAIALARRNAPAERRGAASFAVMDAEHMEFPDESFDIVSGGAILHHLALDRAYAEISRVLARDGYALFIEPLGYNPFINLYRRLTPGLRTPDEHPLLSGDLELARRYFGRVDIRYFYLTTLLALPIAPTRFGRPVIAALNALDRVLFRLLPVLRRYAWIVLIELSQPAGAAALSRSCAS